MFESGNPCAKIIVLVIQPEKGGELRLFADDRLNLALNREIGMAISHPPGCPFCGWRHDNAFTQIFIPDCEPIFLGGVLPPIVRLVHRSHEKGFGALNSKDETLLAACGGYGNPCKAFHSLNRRDAYKMLFDTRRRGFISLRGATGRNGNNTERNLE